MTATETERTDLQTALIDSGGVVSEVDARRVVRTTARWISPPPGALPSAYEGSVEKLIEALQSVRVDDGDAPVTTLSAPGSFAPFARMPNTHVEELDLEDSQLRFAELAGARIRDARFGGTDLRGADARGSQWIEVGLAEADLRWANFAHTSLQYSNLNHANCAHIDLGDSTGLESAIQACFHHATAPRWSPVQAVLSESTFRNADLGANFTGARLEKACFDGADLTGACFRGANLRGATFWGANTAGTIFGEVGRG